MVVLASYITACMWCDRVLRQGRDSKVDENWEGVDPKILARHTLSHGVCPACTEEMWEQDRTRGEGK